MKFNTLRLVFANAPIQRPTKIQKKLKDGYNSTKK